MSNGNAANHWRAIEEEKLRKQIMELEDDRDNWKALASQINTDWIPANKQMADRIAELTAQKTRSQEHYIKLLNDAEAENQRLREAGNAYVRALSRRNSHAYPTPDERIEMAIAIDDTQSALFALLQESEK